MNTNYNDMKNQLFSFVWKYKWFVIPGVFFITLFLIIFANQLTQQAEKQQLERQQQQNGQQQSDVTNSDGSKPNEADSIRGNDGNAIINPYDDPETIISKQLLPDQTVMYTYDSPVVGRPNMTNVTQDQNTVLFNRSVSDPKTPIALNEYLSDFGQPEQTYSGSVYYGPDAIQYLYPSQGLAFIGNPKTNQVLEVHTFVPFSLNEYVTNYGSDVLPNVKPTEIPPREDY